MLHNRSRKILEKIKAEPFQPLVWLSHPHLQTIFSIYWPDKVNDKHHFSHDLTLKDGDQLVIMENKPNHEKQKKRTIILNHGLTGCFQSNYMSRLAEKLSNDGYHVFRVNQRGCGPGLGKAAGPAHSGRSEDFREIILWASNLLPSEPITLIGISLSGNITLKLLGEIGKEKLGNLDSAISISPPIDLSASAQKLIAPSNFIYDKYFSARIKKIAHRTIDDFSHLPRITFPKKINIRMLDDYYTAPLSGFKDANDYYHKCSSFPIIKNIKIPTLILASTDDPVVDTEAYLKLEDNEYIDFIATYKGGHVGFLSKSTPEVQDKRWMDHIIIKWITYTHQKILDQ